MYLPTLQKGAFSLWLLSLCFIMTAKVLSYKIFHNNYRKRFIYKKYKLILYVCFHEKTYLTWSLNLAYFMDLLLDCYKYDKTKIRIIVINYQIVNQIFRIQQHCRRGMALQTCCGVLSWRSNENTYKARMPIFRITFEWSFMCLISLTCRMNFTKCFAKTAIRKSK